jgi:hypothetical protein
MLSIGKLAPGTDPGAYYLDRVGCPMEYYTGEGEAPGVWIGDGARSLGLDGALTTERDEGLLRGLLDGIGPDGEQLSKPVVRSDPRGRVLTKDVIDIVRKSAALQDVEVEEVLTRHGRGELVGAWERSMAELDRAQRRPVWPAPTMKAATAVAMLQAAGLDPAARIDLAEKPRRFRDRLTRALGHADDTVDVRLPGLDLTLSAPKSVSVLYALADPDHTTTPDSSTNGADRVGPVAGKVQDAHRVAVTAAVDYLQLTSTDALRGHHKGDGTDRMVSTDGFIGAAFEHRSSRSGDPQLHTHVVVANLLHGEDGKWSALNTREIYGQARTAGFVYQAVLRGELTRTLGVQWDEVRKGQADIKGMPKGLLRLFSKRRAQIDAALEARGLEGARGAQFATLDTRPAKPKPTDGLSLREQWQHEARGAGHDIDRILDTTLGAAEPTRAQAVARQFAAVHGEAVDALADALLTPEGVTAKRSTFDRKDLLRAVCERLPTGLPVTLTTLRAVATRVLRDGRVVPLLGDAPVQSRRYSTTELLETETRALTLATARLNEQTAVVPTELLQTTAARASQVGLSPEQTAMLHRLLSSGDGVEVVVGAAGSGKTAALALAAQAWADAGLTVRGTALAAIAARVLADSAGIPATSLQKLLNHIDAQAGDADAMLPPGGVLIVDEAGMVGTRTLDRLISLTAERGTKLVLVGDPKQLPEIDAGGLFGTLAARLPASHLVRNQRQQQRWEQHALRELRDGDPTRALAAYRRRGRLRITDSLEQLTDRLLADYETALSGHRPERVLVIASSRSDARRLNALLRQRMLEHGRLGTDELSVPVAHRGDDTAGTATRGYRVGEQVLVTVNDYPRDLLNGCRGTVTHLDLDSASLQVRLDDGRTVHLDQAYLQTGQLTHGYALTAHKAQGVTVDVALLWGTQVLTRETGYVAMSRGRETNTLYATWDLLRRDIHAEKADLDRPPSEQRGPERDAKRDLTRAALAERLGSSGRQRTARSWWRRRPNLPTGDPQLRPAVERGRAVGH